MIRYFDPQPTADLPARLPSPFAMPPHPIAVRAAAELVRDVLPQLDCSQDGKMFGVLVVRDGDRYGYLQGFSGMLEGAWHVDGFVGPTFDLAARDAFWMGGEAELAAIDDELAVLRAAVMPLRNALATTDARHELARVELRALHRARREARHLARDEGRGSPELDHQSRGDAAARDRMTEAHADERTALATHVAEQDAAIAEREAHKAARSRHWLVRIHATYAFASARGEVRALASLFANQPPGGAGDCAAPKLFAHAYRHGLVPIALAELWWGAAPATGDRRAGVYYPACRGKCGPILAHVLDGTGAEPPPIFGNAPIAADEPRVVFEDDWLVVVDKPCGLLSIPGRGDALADCVASRLRARYPAATGPLVVHRLDLDTSGLLMAAKDAATHAELQRLFARREIAKRYVALVDGAPSAARGTIDLALRVDVDDRPRQIHDPVHGKAAVTDWEVLAREGDRTRVLLVPHTGRTHQLRVHCAHPAGLAAPIVGDRLYGRQAERLHLHATSLVFTHPRTGHRVELVSAVPF